MNAIFSLFMASIAVGTTNQMTKFEYTSCVKSSCVAIQAPKAFIGASQENFTTTGTTELRLTDGKGKPLTVYKGESATYNPSLQSLVLELPNGGFLLYSLKDGKISDFRSGVAK